MEKKEEVKLLDFWASPFTMRVRMALAAKGVIGYDRADEPNDPMTKSELLLRSNPVHKKVPVLIHNGNPICESLIIIEYIDETFPSDGSDVPPLLPADPLARANARFWADFIDKKVVETGTKLWKLKPGDVAAKAAVEEFLEALRLIESELGDKEFFGGGAVGFVDITLAPFACSWFYSFELNGGFRVADHCPGIAAWAGRISELAGAGGPFARCLEDPEKIYEYMLVLKKRYGLE